MHHPKRFDFRSKALHSFTINILRKIFLALIGIILARTLGPDGRGEVGLIMLINSLVLSLISVGIGNAQNHLRRKYSVNIILANSVAISVIMGIISGVVFYPMLLLLQNVVFNGMSALLLLTGLALMPLQLWAHSVSRTFQSIYDIKTYNYTKLMRPSCHAVLLFFAWSMNLLNLESAVALWLVSLGVNWVIMIIWLSRSIELQMNLIKVSVIKDIIVYATKIGLGGIFGFFQYRFDVFIVSYLIDMSAVGLYIVGISIAEILWRFPGAVSSVLLPKISNSSDKQANEVTAKVCRQMWVVLLFVSVIMLITIRPLVELIYGHDFIDSSIVAMLVLPGVVLVSIWKLLINDMNARGYPLYYGVTAGMSAVAMVIFDLLLIPFFGIFGAAIAATCGYSLSFITMIVIFSNKTSVKLSAFFPGWSDIRLFFSENLAFTLSFVTRFGGNN